MSYSIFLSHASKDRQVAMAICNALESHGFACWIASRNVLPGQNYQESITRAIRSSKVMILIFTANANNSDEIKKELALASRAKLIVIPLRVEDVEPCEALDYELATRQWIDLFEDRDRALESLTAQLSTVVAPQEKIEVAPVVPTAAKERPNPKTSPPAKISVDDALTKALEAKKRNDDVEALRWYRIAADLGDASAQNAVGFLHTYGDGVARNYEEGMRWYLKAAQQGDVDAFGNIAFLYLEGIGVPQDHARARYWYRLAAEQGDADAQFNVGLLYANGSGDAKDPKQARIWMTKAAENGSDQATLWLAQFTS